MEIISFFGSFVTTFDDVCYMLLIREKLASDWWIYTLLIVTVLFWITRAQRGKKKKKSWKPREVYRLVEGSTLYIIDQIRLLGSSPKKIISHGSLIFSVEYWGARKIIRHPWPPKKKEVFEFSRNIGSLGWVFLNLT